jgi:hypothetical protein
MVLIWLLRYDTFQTSTESSIYLIIPYFCLNVWLKICFCDQKNTNTEETEVLGTTRELQDGISRRGPGQRKRKPPRWVIPFWFHTIILHIEKRSLFEITRWSKEASNIGSITLLLFGLSNVNMQALSTHLSVSQICDQNLFCCKKSTFLASLCLNLFWITFYWM